MSDALSSPKVVPHPVGGGAKGGNAAAASSVATRIGRTALSLGNYPGRGWVGTFWRKRSRRQGGRSFYCRAEDGVRLAGWFSPAEVGLPGRLPVVMSHGWCEVKEFHFHQARRLNRLGHDVVLFDHRSHGRSRGRHVTFGVRERGDLNAVADAAVAAGLIGDRFITMGFSLGAATVLQHAATDPRVAGVVAFAPFVDFRQAIRSFRLCLAPWIDEAWLLRGFEQAARQSGFEVNDASTLEAVRRLEAPVLLVEAGRDRNLPPRDHTRQLLPVMTRGPVELLTIDKACHQNLCRRRWPALDTAVADFCAALR